MYSTKKYPLEPDDTIKIKLDIESKTPRIQWEAFSEDKESLGTGIIKAKTEKTTQKENSQKTSTQKSTPNEIITIKTDKNYYETGGTLVISGKVRTVLIIT